VNLLSEARLRLPVRLKLAVVSAGLTFAILLLFAVVVGTFTVRRLNSSFDSELRSATASLADRIRLRPEPTVPEDLLSAASAGGAEIRVLDRSGRVIGSAPLNGQDLGPPSEDLHDLGDFRISSRPLLVGNVGGGNFQQPLQGHFAEPVGYVQFARPLRGLNATVARIKAFLGFGVLGGTALAFLAGLAVARRAMRPVTRLTGAAREVARTRDPSTTLPKPEANDEVADLAHTLEDMLGELGAARAETEAALSRQREFVADASHELRTPLTSILANLELLEAELKGEQADIAGSALRSSRRMRRLVADLLLLARADAGRQAPRKPVDVALVAREAVAEAAPLAVEHQLALDAPGQLWVRGVPDDLHRAALNLIENALAHTPSGTPVTVSARAGDGFAWLEVADRGPGVPAELRDRVFERFSRGGGDTGPPTGSGLGLAIVRAVAQAHGGSVTLEDAEGGGARFVLRLPLAQAPSEAPVEAAQR
jgi:two-component system OmpR family sensor kinase